MHAPIANGGPVVHAVPSDFSDVCEVHAFCVAWIHRLKIRTVCRAYWLFPNVSSSCCSERSRNRCSQPHILVCQRIHLASKLQATGTWSAAALPPHRLCYRPVVFYATFVSSRFHFLKDKCGALFKDVTNLISYAYLNCVSMKLCNLKLSKLGECLYTLYKSLFLGLST
jgi:hypothetical protein